MKSEGGHITGDISALYGAIDAIDADADLGSSTNTVQISAKDGIKSIIADRIWADIDAMASGANSTGDLRYVKTRTGAFTGSIFARRIESPNNPAGLDIAGDLAADIESTQRFDEPILINGSIPTGRTLTIGTNLSAVSKIRILGGLAGVIDIAEADGLKGNILINANGIGPGDWTGTVNVGSITLSPSQSQPDRAPHYERTSLGGGAIGISPFSLHDFDCAPPNGTIDSTTRSSVKLRFYGPVVGGSGSPVKVFKAEVPWPVEEGPSYVDVTSSYSSAISGRELTVTGSFAAGFQYKIEPVLTGGDALKCADVSGTPTIGEDFDYLLKILTGTP